MAPETQIFRLTLHCDNVIFNLVDVTGAAAPDFMNPLIKGGNSGMTQKSSSIAIVCLLIFFVMTYGVHAQEKITGPWLWMIAPTEPGQGGANSINVDSLAVASNGAVTEADVAVNGANEGDRVGNFRWTLGKIAATGSNNINDCLNRIGMAADNVDDHSAYALFTFESDTTRNNVTMRVGSDDAIKVWLNGKVVHNNPIDRGASDFLDEFHVDLVAGDNLLMVKVSERSGGWSMFVGIDDSVGIIDPQDRPIVRLIYIRPSDRGPEPGIDAKIIRVVKEAQQFFANEMERHGFGRKTFLIETDADGKPLVHHVNNEGQISQLNQQIRQNIYSFIVASQQKGCGIGGSEGFSHGSAKIFYGDEWCLNWSVAAHELGHAFGLPHDFRINADNNLMSYGARHGILPKWLSKCSAEWLDVHRAFTPGQPPIDKNEPTRVKMLPPVFVSSPNTIRLRFEITDLDGIHQAQLLLNGQPPSHIDYSLQNCQRIYGKTGSTIEFTTTNLPFSPRTGWPHVALRVIDVHGNWNGGVLVAGREIGQLFTINMNAVLPPPEVVSIPDAELEHRLRNSYQLDHRYISQGSSGEPITTHAMLDLKELNASNLGIIDLTGLEHAHNLRELNLGSEHIQGQGYVNRNAISDFSPLEELTQLQLLDLDHIAISDITALMSILSESANLRYLSLSGTSISDVSALVGFTQLVSLTLSSNSISDIFSLAELTQLQILDLNNNSITDISPLSRLNQLTHLYLYSNNISDISPLSGLNQLTHLHLDDNALTDISPLSTLSQLTHLHLNDNALTDISPLSTLNQLIYLYLGNNALTNVSALSGLNQLTHLYLYSNNISDISPLSGLNQLTSLQLGNNELTDVSALSGLNQLTSLYLYSNNISDISPLSGLNQLTSLQLGNNELTDVSPLSGLNQLTHLELANNSISDVSPLVSLNLTGTVSDNTGLYLWNNPLNYASINTHIPAMQAKGIEVKFDNRTPTTFVKISGPAQQGVVNTGLPFPFVVEVKDQHNRAFAGVPVTFAITEGGGHLSTTSTTTNLKGRAEAHLTLGRTPGTTTVRVTAAKISQPLQFTATATLLNTPIAMPDANLRAKVAATIGKGPEYAVTAADMLTLTLLTANNANIHDLTGLHYASNLKTLSLDNNNLSDVTPLTALTELETLSLDQNRLSDVTPLARLTQLETLSLASNSLSDVSALAGLRHLKTLHLKGNLLSYASLHTHVPAIQARDATVTFSSRTPSTILNTSTTHGVAGAAISVRVKVQDENGFAFSEVPVTFNVTAGGGQLSHANAITDDFGRAWATLTLGPTPGKNTIRVVAAEAPRAVSFSITAIDGNSRVTIQDAALRAKIENALGKARNATITAVDMLTLRQIEAPNANIQSLRGIEHAHNLVILNLSGEYIETGYVNSNVISDFSPLLGLTQLTTLNLSVNSLSDVSFLSELPQLKTLYFLNNNISDISPISGLNQLTHLYLGNNSIADVSALSGLNQLTHLHLDDNALTDISPLSTLSQLTHLYLNDNALTDISPLSTLNQLIYLYLGNNALTNVSALSGLNQLTHLYLAGNSISDVSALSGLNQLTHLYLHSNALTDISPLSTLSQLTHLYLGYNNIADISSLSGLSQLASLSLYNNSISDVSPLVALNLTGTEWDNTGLYLWGNPLNYASINTYIPAMQARGIEVKFDPRTYPALDIISGSGQHATGGGTLAEPLIVAAIDANGTPMSGVPVIFTITEGPQAQGNGELSTTTAMTDANGRAETTFTLGANPGKYHVHAIAASLNSSVPFMAIATAPAARLTADVNGDGVVNIQDLVMVSSQLGQAGQNEADVNEDGAVNIQDLVFVAGELGADAAAPSAWHRTEVGVPSREKVEQWLMQAHRLRLSDTRSQRGVFFFQRLLIALAPKETALLPNYPNPFNPETWIPYQLPEPSDVTLRIYSVKGTLVRTLRLGYQSAGVYHSKNRAAYWDGRNEHGESVASGVYFYTLSTKSTRDSVTAGDFTATRKMLIRK